MREVPLATSPSQPERLGRELDDAMRVAILLGYLRAYPDTDLAGAVSGGLSKLRSIARPANDSQRKFATDGALRNRILIELDGLYERVRQEVGDQDIERLADLGQGTVDWELYKETNP